MTWRTRCERNRTATSERSWGARTPLSSPRRATGPSAAAAAAGPAQPAPVASPPKLTDEELARELQRELSGVRKRTRETVRYDPMAR